MSDQMTVEQAKAILRADVIDIYEVDFLQIGTELQAWYTEGEFSVVLRIDCRKEYTEKELRQLRHRACCALDEANRE